MVGPKVTDVYLFVSHPQAAADKLPGGDVNVDAHAVHALAPVAFEYVPGGHGMQAAEDDAPLTPEYTPAGQLVQLLAAITFEYLPVEQFVHALAPSSEYAPAAQVRHTLAFLAAGTFEYVPTVQLVHNELPVTFLNLPGTQAVQAPPSGPVYPVLHKQLEISFEMLENGD